MFCHNCGKQVKDGCKFCPKCGESLMTTSQPIEQSVESQEKSSESWHNISIKNRKTTKKKVPLWKRLLIVLCLFFWPLAIVAIILMWIWKIPKSTAIKIVSTAILLLYFLVGMILSSENQVENASTNPTITTNDISNNESDTVDDSSAINDTLSNESEIGINETPQVQSTTDYSQMKIGDIGVKNNIYVSLDYVKKMNYLPTALGTTVDSEIGHDVIIAFFEFGNNDSNLTKVSPNDITCYADGKLVGSIDNTFKVVCDGVHQFYNSDLDAGKLLLSCEDYSVPTGWEELKFFYGSECIWTVTPEEVSEADFTGGGLLTSTNTYKVTPIDSVLYNGDYELIYKGSEIYYYDDFFNGQVPYVIFKYTINNTSNIELDTSLIGYNMRAYRNNYLLQNATYTKKDDINGYQNIYVVDSIYPGMSADIYVAFETNDTPSSYLMVFDDGYIKNDIKGIVYDEH